MNYQQTPKYSTGCPKKEPHLINNRTKLLCSLFKFFSILNKAYPNLDFETRIVEIRSILSEIHHFEAECLKL